MTEREKSALLPVTTAPCVFARLSTCRAAHMSTPQKSQSSEKACDASCSCSEAMTPFFWYSPTRFSKKFVLPCRLISSMQRGHDALLLVLTNALLEEVRLALQADQLHPVERVRR